MNVRTMAAAAGLFLACTSQKTVQTTSSVEVDNLPKDGPASELFFAQVRQQRMAGPAGLGEAVLSFALTDSAYALVGQVRDGKIRVLFPASAEGTGYVRAHDVQSVLLDYNGTGPVFLITRKKPIDMRLSGVGPYFADVGLEEYADTKDPIKGIDWYARQVADTNYRVEVADVATSMANAKRWTRNPPTRNEPWKEAARQGKCTNDPRPHTKGAPMLPLCPRDP